MTRWGALFVSACMGVSTSYMYVEVSSNSRHSGFWFTHVPTSAFAEQNGMSLVLCSRYVFHPTLSLGTLECILPLAFLVAYNIRLLHHNMDPLSSPFPPFFSPSFPSPTLLQGFTSQQLSLVESSTVMIEEREKEISSIVQSISDISEMYRDLATMVVDQVDTLCRTTDLP